MAPAKTISKSTAKTPSKTTAKASSASSKKKQTKITGFATASAAAKIKPKSRPNGSILNYFKKADDQDLFIGNGTALVEEGVEETKVEVQVEVEEEEEEEDEDIYTAADLFGLSPIEKRGKKKGASPQKGKENGNGNGKRDAEEGNKEERGRYNEDETPVKRRRLSPPREEETPKKTTGDGEEATSTPGMSGTENNKEAKQQKPQPVKKKRGPFVDDSDDDDGGNDQQDAGNDDESGEEEEVNNKKGTSRVLAKQDMCSGRDELTFGEVAPLLRAETSGTGNDNLDLDSSQGDDPADAEQNYDVGEDEGYFDDGFDGEELREMRYMQEQARLQAEEAGDGSYEDVGAVAGETSVMEECCPICDGSLAGVSETEATAHVNGCLDGNPTPLPASKKASPPPKREGTVDSPQIANRFSKAAIPRPGQAVPFRLGGGDSTSGDSESNGNGTSAFAKLMSGKAEDTAWATAAAAEHSSRGMPAYKRTCPFYKIMPNNFSICVDAFRYGAVKDCNAYFLSHFHSDHYIGLTARWTHGPIYCSKVTGSLVKSQLKTAAKYVVELEFDEKVPVPDTNGVFVTMIPANHCPGSSLFLFEKVINGGKTQRILHCGDFRACPEHITHPSLRPNLFDAVEGKIKRQKIDVCYLDTTYLNPRYSFPPQDGVIRSCAELCVALNDGVVSGDDSRWNSLLRKREGGAPAGVDSVSKFFKGDREKTTGTNGKGSKESGIEANEDEDCVVIEQAPPPLDAFTAIQKKTSNRNRLLVVCGTYSIGKERICKAIAQALKTKIFATPAKIKICQELNDPELSNLLTSDPHEAQVHMQMIMEIRAETLAEYLESYKAHFSKIVGFRPSGWNYSPGSSSKSSRSATSASAAVEKILGSTGTPIKNITANLAPGSVPTTHLLHGPVWRTRFFTKDLTPQRGSGKEAMCFGVPYSEHSSFRELAMFLMALRIERVVPTVNVRSEQSRKRMKGWTDRWLAERRRGGVVDVLVEKDDEDDDGKEGIALWEGKDGRGGGAYW